MADFCLQCSLELFHEDLKDFAEPDAPEERKYLLVICEGCGPTWVDRDGRCLGECANQSHKAVRE